MSQVLIITTKLNNSNNNHLFIYMILFEIYSEGLLFVVYF